MKTRIAWLLPFASMAAGATDLCPLDLHAMNAPGLVVEGYSVACDLTPTAPSALNECGVLRWVAANDPSFIALLRDHRSFSECAKLGVETPCSQGKYSADYLVAQLRRMAVEVQALERDNPFGGTSSSNVCALAERGLASVAPPSKPFTVLPSRLTLTRDVSDPKNSFGKAFDAPFVFSYIDDREKGDSDLGLYGTIGFNFFDRADGGALSSFLKIDTAAGAETVDSSATLGLIYAGYFSPERGPQNYLLQLSPQYLTDRDNEREVHQFQVKVTPTWDWFLRMGYPICPGGCSEKSAHQFYWSPTLGAEWGRVVDAAESEQLIDMEGEEYARFAPSVTMSYRPLGSLPKLLLRLDYTHRWDADEDWDRGLGTLGIHYAIASNAFWSISWKKGRQDGSFEPVDTVLFGFGIRQ